MALWDGRFEGGPAEQMQRFSESLGVDLMMFEQDIDGSIAHSTMLAEVGLLTAPERDAIHAGLEQVRGELRRGDYRPGIELEDVHMAVESRLTEITAAGGKLHTARSRNDQVATDVRLWMKGAMAQLDAALGELVSELRPEGAEGGGGKHSGNFDYLTPGFIKPRLCV